MNEFSKLVSDFFIRYLTNQKNASENTIKTYRDAVVQLLEFMNSKGIKANKIKIINTVNPKIISFLFLFITFHLYKKIKKVFLLFFIYMF